MQFTDEQKRRIDAVVRRDGENRLAARIEEILKAYKADPGFEVPDGVLADFLEANTILELPVLPVGLVPLIDAAVARLRRTSSPPVDAGK